MITIELNGKEEIRIRTEFGIFLVTQRMIDTGENGIDFRTVLDIEHGDGIDSIKNPFDDNIVRFAPVDE